MKSISYSEWVQFTFYGPETAEPGPPQWYPGSAPDAAAHLMTFFAMSKETLALLPREVACAGLRLIPSIDGYGGLLSWPELSYETRIAIADAHFPLFRDTFSADGYDGAAFMWWEWLIGARWNDGPSVQEDQRIRRHMFAVIRHILTLESDECIRSGVHGLNEFNCYDESEEEMREIIAGLLKSRPLSAELVRYAHRVADGQAP